VSDGCLWPQEKKDLGVEPASQDIQLHIAANALVLCCHLANTNEKSDSAFYQIALVLVIFRVGLITLPFNALTLLVGRQEGHPIHANADSSANLYLFKPALYIICIIS